MSVDAIDLTEQRYQFSRGIDQCFLRLMPYFVDLQVSLSILLPALLNPKAHLRQESKIQEKCPS